MAAKKKAGGRAKAKTPASKAAVKKRRPARKKPAPQSKARKKATKPSLINEFKKIGLGIAILLAVCMTTAMIADILLKSGRPVSSSPAVQTRRAPAEPKKLSPVPLKKKKEEPQAPQVKTTAPGLMKKTDRSSIVYEVFEGVDPEHARKKPVRPAAGDKTPVIAIIIDDIGYDKRLAMALYDLDKDITFSVLPFSPFGKTIADRLSVRGAELMLHLPMEPTQYPRVNPGPGALLSSMTPDALLAQLKKDLDEIPGVKGVNNHMGSKLTAISGKMHQIFTVLKKEDLFFIDSRTSSKSKAEMSAKLFQLRFSHRDIFLDNSQNINYISGQFRKLVRRAEKHGHAIGIGHPYQATLDTLRIEIPKLKGRVKVVPASRLVHVPG